MKTNTQPPQKVAATKKTVRTPVLLNTSAPAYASIGALLDWEGNNYAQDWEVDPINKTVTAKKTGKRKRATNTVFSFEELSAIHPKVLELVLALQKQKTMVAGYILSNAFRHWTNPGALIKSSETIDMHLSKLQSIHSLEGTAGSEATVRVSVTADIYWVPHGSDNAVDDAAIEYDEGHFWLKLDLVESMYPNCYPIIQAGLAMGLDGETIAQKVCRQQEKIGVAVVLPSIEI